MRVPDLGEHVRSMGFAGFKIPLPVGVFSLLESPRYVFTEPRVGYYMPEGEEEVGDGDGKKPALRDSIDGP